MRAKKMFEKKATKKELKTITETLADQQSYLRQDINYLDNHQQKLINNLDTHLANSTQEEPTYEKT